MLRILSECAASVRKSLQGWDYFAGYNYKVNYSLKTLCRIEDVYVGACAPVKASAQNTKI